MQFAIIWDVIPSEQQAILFNYTNIRFYNASEILHLFIARQLGNANLVIRMKTIPLNVNRE